LDIVSLWKLTLKCKRHSGTMQRTFLFSLWSPSLSRSTAPAKKKREKLKRARRRPYPLWYRTRVRKTGGKGKVDRGKTREGRKTEAQLTLG